MFICFSNLWSLPSIELRTNAVLKDWITCAAVCLSLLQAKMSDFLSSAEVIPNKVLPAAGANLDCSSAVVSFASETFGVEMGKRGAHITASQACTQAAPTQ